MQTKTHLIPCGRESVLCSSAELSHPLSAACSQTLPLKTKYFSPELLTNGSYVRIRTGDPLCFYERNTAGHINA